MDFRYLAGFIDGEGYIGILKTSRGYSYCKLEITNTNQEIIEWLASLFGGSKHEVKRKRITTPNGKRVWVWNLQGKKLLPVLLEIQPYARVKKRQIDLAIEFLQGPRPSAIFKMATLNKRGLGKLNLVDPPFYPKKMPLSLYNPLVHKAGDKVLVKVGGRLREAVVPELDGDGREIPQL